MKKAGWIIAAVLCVALVCGAFYYVKVKSDASQDKETELTEVQKLITKDLSKDYPVTPREVIKLYNRVITCYYKDDYSEDELEQLANLTWQLFDEELQEENPWDSYFASLKDDIEDYASRSRYIAQSSVCDSDEVVYRTVDGEQVAYVTASYFVREGSGYEKTYQQYVLRQNEDGEWKMLGFYKVDADSSEED